jgi:2-keto-3-deoxy-L-rhamnonate aldolase RhmA
LMSLKLMYITNSPQIAEIAQGAGVDRIFIDLETLGKSQRQGHVDSVKSHHSIKDIAAIKPFINQAQLLVRVNPINPESGQEIEEVLANGAEIIMLPMFRTAQEVQKFIGFVAGRAKVMLLLETSEAAENIESILAIAGIDEVHIGLNDLHLAYKKRFMFELFIDGTVSKLVQILREKGYTYGIGGIARIGYGLVPAEYIITELYKLGARGAILSRSFCNVDNITDFSQAAELFKGGIRSIRDWEQVVSKYSPAQFEENYKTLCELIKKVIKG